NNPICDSYVSPRVFYWTASRVLPWRNLGPGIPDPFAGSISIRKGDSGKAEVACAGFENSCSSTSQNADRSARQVGNGPLSYPAARRLRRSLVHWSENESTSINHR